ncbi:hypothetical protein Tco_1303774 [Tanacetum coccineum]
MSANDNFSLHDDEDLSLHDDASLDGSVPATNKGDAPAKPPQIITTNTLSNIKLPILQKDDYDTWAMEMEHYLEYIDNEVWKVIQNGNSKKRVTKGKDGVYRVLPPTTQEEQFADEKERKARTLLLMAVPKDHLKRFHGMDDAKKIWAAIKTRFGGNVNSKKMQKAVLKQQFEAFTISSKENLEKGYDRFQKLLSKLDALGAGVSDEDANHKFLRSLPPAWDSLAMTMRTKKNIDTLSIDDLYNNLSPKPLQASTSQAKAQDLVVYHILFQSKTNCYYPGLADELSILSSTNALMMSASLKRFKGRSQQEARRVRITSRRTEKEALMTIDEDQISWFTPRPIPLSNIRPNLSTASNTIKTGRVNVNTGHGNVSSGRVHVNSVSQFKTGASRFNAGKQHVNSGSVHAHTHMGKIGTAVKTSAGCVWRKPTPHSNINSGPTPDSNVNVSRGPQGRPKPVKAWVPKRN